MGARGPVGKRDAERMGHRTKAEKALLDKVEMSGEVLVPEPNPEWHPVAVEWYTSLAASGQSQFFEPSDWASAYYVAVTMSINLQAGRFSSELFKAVWSAVTDRPASAGCRRRERLETERELEKAGEVSDLDEFKRRLASGS